MNKHCLCGYLLFLTIVSSASITTSFAKTKAKKKDVIMKFGIDVGTHYSKVFNAKRIEYSNSPFCPNCGRNTEVSFIDKSSWGYQLGGTFQIDLPLPHFFISSGLYFFNRTSISEGIKDTVVKYNPPGSNPAYSIHEISKNLEQSHSLGYSNKGLTFICGANILLFKKSEITFLYADETTQNKADSYLQDSYSFFKPFVKLGYSFLLKNSKYLGTPYFSVERLKTNNYAFSIGLLVQIIPSYSLNR